MQIPAALPSVWPVLFRGRKLKLEVDLIGFYSFLPEIAQVLLHCL